MPYMLIVGAASTGLQKDKADKAADEAGNASLSGTLEAIAASNAAYEKQAALYAPILEQSRREGSDFFAGLENDAFDPGEFKNVYQESPAFNFNLEEAERLKGQRAAAGGKYFSGQTAKEMIRMRQDAQSEDYGNSFNRNMNEYGARFNDAADKMQKGFGNAQNAYSMDTNLMNARGGLSAQNTGYQIQNLERQSELNDYRDYASQQAANSITEAGAAWAGNKFGMPGDQ